LIDCGEGTLYRLLHWGIKQHKISHICISHLHPDHYLGIIALIFNWAMDGRTTPLYIFAPNLLQQIIGTHLQLTHTTLPFLLHFIDLQSNKNNQNTAPNLIFDDNNLQVRSLPLHHGVPCFGFVFTQKNTLRRYAYITDTTPQPQYTALLNGVHLLYHEATYLHALYTKATQYNHTTAQQAAAIATQYNAEKLIIGHFSARYPSLQVLLTEAQSFFTNTHLATEGSQWLV
jgi:ribonuclease Z